MKALVAAFCTLLVVAVAGPLPVAALPEEGVSNVLDGEAKALSSNLLDAEAKHATNQSVTTGFFLREFPDAVSEDEDRRSKAGRNFIDTIWSKVMEFFQKAENKLKKVEKAVNDAMKKAGEKVCDFFEKILGI
ncbi:uncharacterized protein LOC119440294 [Dermacentor silvarum]|uniref:uncharacterized protein LOC119440294 n=1 Tax=Dermacentor silvarum TaxID=543639 RepID=UPI001899915A|nr:uncharacterized protein LOC119440294 [Dermacentor silvarum]